MNYLNYDGLTNCFLFYNLFSALHEYELVSVILEFFDGIAEDKDSYVRKAVCQLIINVCNDCDSRHHEKLLKILEKVCLLLLLLILFIHLIIALCSVD